VQGAQQTVPPGQTGSFELKLDTSRFFGAVTKSADIISNAANGTVRLTLTASVWCPVTVNPAVVAFGSVLKGTSVAPRLVEISITEPDPLPLGAITSSNPYFQIETKVLEEGRKYQLAVSVPELGDRAQNADIVIALGHPRMKELRIGAFINAVDPLMVQPVQLTIAAATMKANGVPPITVFCHDPAITALEVTDLAWSGGGGVTAVFDRQGGNRWGRINLTFPGDFNPETAKDAGVTFQTNHPCYPRVTVPVHFVVSTPAIPGVPGVIR
jgi:hypothetical protein